MIERKREIESLSTHEGTHEGTKRTKQSRVRMPRQKVEKVETEEKFMLGLETERGGNPIVETEEGMER